MTQSDSRHYDCHWANLALILILAVTASGCSRANQSVPNSAAAANTEVPAEFARRGLSLLRQDGDTDPDEQHDSLKADALIMRAWELQQVYPQSCLSVWQLTKLLADQQAEPSQRLALTSLYLSSVDAAVESSMTPEGFEASWTVRESVLAKIEELRLTVIDRIVNEIQQAEQSLATPDGLKNFVTQDADRWSDLSAEVRAILEPMASPPPRITARVRSLCELLSVAIQEKLQLLSDGLEAEMNDPSDSNVANSEQGAKGEAETQSTGTTGPITLLIERLDELVTMRESVAVASWMILAEELAATMHSHALACPPADQLDAIEKLRSRLFDTRALKYNFWAADLIFNADRRGGDGLLLLGPIDTRLLMGPVGTSYSITEGKILTEIQDPFARQVRIREMLAQAKRQLIEF